jgi:hypothetical protein
MTKGLHYYGGGSTVCAQCGYRFIKGDEALRIKQTGDIIHSDCFIDYSEDNREELSEEFEF